MSTQPPGHEARKQNETKTKPNISGTDNCGMYLLYGESVSPFRLTVWPRSAASA